MNQGVLVVVSAPSGAGKTSVVREARGRYPVAKRAVSATTRPPRPGEQDGMDYHFFTPEEFRRRVADGRFLEWAEVHGNLYGTLRSEVDSHLAAGAPVVLELDVQGMAQLKHLYPNLVSVFIEPPSMEELERRLRLRGVNEEADLQLRLRNARQEMARRGDYDHIIVNDDLDRAAKELATLLRRLGRPTSMEA